VAPAKTLVREGGGHDNADVTPAWHNNGGNYNVKRILMNRKNIADKFSVVKTRFKNGISYLSKGGIRQLFSHIDQAAIKKEVDSIGIDKFINKCALLAAGSGVVTGIGGIATIAIGVPLDMINLLMQQFRVMIAISYHNTGSSEVGFDDFIKLLGTTLKMDTGMAATKNIMEEIAEKLLVNIGSKTSERLVPVVGAVIGGSVNYLFIKRMRKNIITDPAK
jgi:hypothetical protein